MVRAPSTRGRTYLDKYRSAAYAAFASGSLAVPVRVGPGVVALAYRFVGAGTGQTTEIVELGVVQVG